MVHAAESAVREYFDRIFGRRDLTACQDLLAENYVDHDAPAGTPAGPAATRAFLETFLREHDPLEFELVELVAGGDSVAVRARWRGRRTDTGAPLQQDGLLLIKIDPAGRLAERWSAYREE
ncbi:ester cyclase [Microlunatus parietis]|uniref:Ketosteroid isomerase-like protein n=1 Tax=Microlunatus parietis TaxID=682979 RepID=A0A7Y9LDD3_9ACTN|nr:nuclear transport factor 2 family protein [Microlunatus parietis]NYE72660.1 ketosteroid isomerase-like protein [Microlunatus parietis]